ncbi:TetR/AcrR family transcriptional regulator [Longispora albida]|uniref:TetR/AcrR family transcriptional regulator n=1 Tax=Longispora albida TaxID=203523 RepID=UPI00039B1636|nr:TetR/AcrR family transcriptional regulator [Longispora albida]
MPLPRFDRLAADRQAAILAVARVQFAEHGPEAASYNKIIELAGISKTAAYHYFDGKDDLLGAVLDDVGARVLGALGDWEPAGDAAGFWGQLRAGSGRLVAHLAEHPDDQALAPLALERPVAHAGTQWISGVVANGQELGIIRSDLDQALLVAVTTAVLQTLDGWALAGNAVGEEAWSLLAGLWGEPR